MTAILAFTNPLYLRVAETSVKRKLMLLSIYHLSQSCHHYTTYSCVLAALDFVDPDKWPCSSVVDHPSGRCAEGMDLIPVGLSRLNKTLLFCLCSYGRE